MKSLSKSWSFFLLRLGVLAVVVWAVGMQRRAGAWTPDALFFAFSAGAWVLVSVVIEWLAARFGWAVGTTRSVVLLIGAYVLVMAMGFAEGSGTLAVRSFAVYCFLAVYVVGPAASLLSVIAGVLAYMTFFALPDWDKHVPPHAAALAGGAAVLCAWAWGVCAPVLWYSIRMFSARDSSDRAAPLALEPLREEALPAPDSVEAVLDDDQATAAISLAIEQDRAANLAKQVEALTAALAARDRELDAARQQGRKLAIDLNRATEEREQGGEAAREAFLSSLSQGPLGQEGPTDVPAPRSRRQRKKETTTPRAAGEAVPPLPPGETATPQQLAVAPTRAAASPPEEADPAEAARIELANELRRLAEHQEAHAAGSQPPA